MVRDTETAGTDKTSSARTRGAARDEVTEAHSAVVEPSRKLFHSTTNLYRALARSFFEIAMLRRSVYA